MTDLAPAPPEIDLRRRFQRGGMWVLGGRSLGMLTVFASDWVFARVLPAEEYAAYVHALAVVTLCSLVAMFGLQMLVCRLVAAALGVEDRDRARRSLRVTISVAVGTIAITAAVMAAGLPRWAETVLNRPVLGDAALFIAIWTACLAASQILAESFRGLHNLFAASLFGGVSGGLVANLTLLGLALMHVALVGPLSFGVLVALAPLSFVIPLVGMSIWLRWAWPDTADAPIAATHDATATAAAPATSQPDPPITRRLLLVEAMPIMMLQLASHGMDQVGQFTLGSLGPAFDQQLAIYHIVWRIAFIGLIPFTMISLVIAPSLSESHARRSRETLQQVMRGASTIGLATSFPFLIGMILLPAPILSLFKPEFVAGSAALALLAAVQLVRNWLGPCHLALVMTGHQLAAFICYLAASPVLLAGPWAARNYGLFGITCVAGAASTIPRLLQFWVVRQKLRIQPQASLNPRYLLRLASTGMLAVHSPKLAEGTTS